MTLAERLCYLPADFRQKNNPFSIVALVERSGYLSAPQELTRVDVIHALQRKPELVADWLMWSGDQRTPEGWCFDERRDHSYAVYYYPKGDSAQFNDRIEACAEYILRVIPWLVRGKNSN